MLIYYSCSSSQSSDRGSRFYAAEIAVGLFFLHRKGVIYRWVYTSSAWKLYPGAEVWSKISGTSQSGLPLLTVCQHRKETQHASTLLGLFKECKCSLCCVKDWKGCVNIVVIERKVNQAWSCQGRRDCKCRYWRYNGYNKHPALREGEKQRRGAEREIIQGEEQRGREMAWEEVMYKYLSESFQKGLSSVAVLWQDIISTLHESKENEKK